MGTPSTSSGLGPLGAVAALVAFYIGALLFAATLLGIAALLAATLTTIGSKWIVVAAAAFLVAALVVVWSILPRFDRFDPPGPELHEADAPMLYAELRELASASGQAMPSHVYVVPDLNAFVTERGGIMGIGSRRVLGIGLPLLEILTCDELRAVLAHELGHFHGGDTKLGPWLYKVRGGFMRTIVNLGRTASFVGDDFGPFAAVLAFARLPFCWFGNAFTRGTASLSRAQERHADALAVQLVGAEPLVRALEKLRACSGAYEAYVDVELSPVLAHGRRPPILAGFRGFMAEPKIAAAIETQRATMHDDDEPDAFDTHPPLSERAALARALAGSTATVDDRPASVLVRDVDWVERTLVHFGRREVEEHDPIAWTDVVTIHAANWRELVDRRRLQLARMSMSAIPRGPALREHEAARCGRRVDEASDEMLLDAAIAQWSAAIGIALVDLGWTASTSLGESIVLRWGDLECRPLPEVRAWLIGETTPDDWHARAMQLGLAGVDLGATVLSRATAA